METNPERLYLQQEQWPTKYVAKPGEDEIRLFLFSHSTPCGTGGRLIGTRYKYWRHSLKCL